MPYDPNFPPDHQALNAAPFRNQFQGLNDLILERVSYADLYDGINANAAGPVTSLGLPNFTVSNPPTQSEVQAIADFVTAFYVAASRT